MFQRLLKTSVSSSFLLLGPRGTGKSTFIAEQLRKLNPLKIDLLDPETALRLQTRPSDLRKELEQAKSKTKWVFIDEIQKVPELLDIVHQSIEQDKLKFALSGSSARKLKRGGANLLAGRAFIYHLHPLTHLELGESFSLASALRWGTLPKVWNLQKTEDKKQFLISYALTYLQQEILAENIIRKLAPFQRFLAIAAQSNSAIVNYKKIADDAQTDPKNVQSYFQILEDTLLGFFLQSYHRSIRKRQRQSPKFYWFDCGIQRALAQTLDAIPAESTYDYGKLFEAFLINEIFRALEYSKKQFELSYLRSEENAEIDLIIERVNHPTYLIEIKSNTSIREQDVTSLVRFSKDFTNARPICLYRGKISQKVNGIEVLPWSEGIKEILG